MSSDSEVGEQNFIRGIYQSRQAAREAIVDAQARRTLPNRCFIDQRCQDRRIGQAAQRDAHATILNYWSDLGPYGDDCPELWKEELVDGGVAVPKDQTISVETDLYGNPENLESVYQELITETRPVSLDSLAEHWRTEQFVVQIFDDSGDIIETRSHKIFLPVSAAAKVWDQLNKCVRQLKFAAEVGLMYGRDEPPEPPDHIVENAPAFQGDGDE